MLSRQVEDDGLTDFLKGLLEGGPDHRISPDIGGAVFSAIDDTADGLERFQPVAARILANDGRGYSVVRRLIHRTSDGPVDRIDRIVINF